MSTLKINNLQVGQSLTANNNFTWYQPLTPDGTVRFGNGIAGAVTDILTVDKFGNISSSNTITATSFSGSITGSGAGLTSIPNSALTNSSVTINGSSVSLGGSVTIAAGATITDDTTTNATRYLMLGSATSGSYTVANTSSTKLTFNPSTGTVTATTFSGSGASLTGLTAGNLSGTIPSAVLGNSTHYVGTTAIALNRGSGAQTLTGVSIDGNAATATSTDNIDGIAFKNCDSSSSFVVDTQGTNGIGYSTGYTLFGQTDGGVYCSTYSGAWQHQINGDFRTGQIAIRGKNNGTWQAWRTVLDSSNYNSYAPTLTGGGASGTWGINITGNAGYASTVGINYNNDSNATYQMIWGSGNSVYGTGGIYCNPYTDYLYAGSFYTGNWFRSSGQTGWYNESYGGGINMSDSTYVRTYGSKIFYCDQYIIGENSVRGRVLYDYDDTGYYIDPNSTGDTALRIRGGALHGPNPTWGSYLYVGSNGNVDVNTATVAVTNGNLHLDARNGYQIYLNNYATSSYTVANQSCRSPIFYDFNDTGYYADPNGGSRLYSTTNNIYYTAGVGGDSGIGNQSYAIYQQGGAWAHPYPDLAIGYHTGIKIGAYLGYNGTRFYNNSDFATIIASIGDGDNALRSYNNIIAYASDKRLKENIIYIENPIDKVKKLNGVYFDWKDFVEELGFCPSKKHEVGLLAQDVEEVLPEAVEIAPFDYDWEKEGKSKSGEKYLTVKYEKIVPLLIEAIKEQQLKIEYLEKLIYEKI